ncbi:hypothetical protein ACHWQZ_G002467 [Mnemiopsis leidyi]
MITIILLLAVGTAIMAAPSPDQCPRILADAGVTEGFAPLVAHAIHSLALEDIRYFFKSDATEDNGIPTVNMDLSAEERVLPNAPLMGYDDDFSTIGMKSFDMVMRNMNRTNWGSRNDNVLVRVTHVLHMAELWNKISESYKNIARLLDPKSDICACATDIENNDVLNYVQYLAFKIRYPGITSGNATLTERYITALSSEGRTKRSMDEPVGYDYDFCWDGSLDYEKSRKPNFRKLDFDLSDLELLKNVSEELLDGDDGKAAVQLDSDAHWDWWRNMVKRISMGDSAYYDIAVFMFCMLN